MNLSVLQVIYSRNVCCYVDVQSTNAQTTEATTQQPTVSGKTCLIVFCYRMNNVKIRL